MDLFTEEVLLHHGSNATIEKPDLAHSNWCVDFGPGFYLTKDFSAAEKWAAGEETPTVTTYKLSLRGLKVYEFSVNSEWLHFVVDNRDGIPCRRSYNKYDVLVGPTVDATLYNALSEYLDGALSEQNTLKIINCMKFSNQWVLRTQKAIDSLVFKKEYVLVEACLGERLRKERQDGRRVYRELKQRFVGGTYYRAT